eukprot:8146211-Ditylum_brightwellii.AAC.2
MAQLGLCTKQMVATIADNYNHNRPFKIYKLDIKDRFWRLAVSAKDAWNFCYILLEEDDAIPENIEDIKLWYHAVSKWAAREIIQALLDSNITLPKHALEHHMLPPTFGPKSPPDTAPTTNIE